MIDARELLTRRVLLGCLVLVLFVFAPSAQARYRPADGPLSPRLARLARPGLRGASEVRQAQAVGLPAEGPASLVREGPRLLVEAHFEGGVLAHLDDLRAAGARILSASPRYQSTTISVTPAGLDALKSVGGLIAAREVKAPAFAEAPCAGSVVSEGDAQLEAALARADFGVDGSGVTVGILSDSFNSAEGPATTAAGDVLSGDLPGTGNPCGNTNPIKVIAEYPGPLSEATDEGRAMAQVVHDLAPGASIDFATVDSSEEEFADHIRELAAAGASVIVDDVSYFEEPFFQDGPVAVAIEEVVAQGVTYLTAAGNDNLPDKSGDEEISSWETEEFRDSGECPPALKATSAEPDECLDFNPGPSTDDTFGITVEPKGELIVDLQWAEPWFGVKADLDAYLLNEEDEPLSEVEGGTSNSVGEGKEGEGEPVELLFWENKSSSPVKVNLAIDRCFSVEPQRAKLKGCNPYASETAKPRVKLILAENGFGVASTEYPKSAGGDVVGPTVYGHAGAAGAIAVGAVPVNNSNEAEFYTSRGPVTHYFGPVAGKTPAKEFKPPQVIEKPDIAASDCGRTTFFVPSEKHPGEFVFCGTSAAAPHAAAVVALARQANPSATPAQLRKGLRETARPVGTFKANVVGAGLIDANSAIDEIALPPKISFVNPPSTTNRRQPSIAFTANRPVTFSCSLDSGPSIPCVSPFTPEKPLGDGPHTLVVRGLDLSGRTGQSETLVFTVDTVPPRTFFKSHPRKNIRIRGRRVRVVFRFGSNTPGAQFVCRVDGGLFHFCPAVLSRRFGLGAHTIRVKALDQAGNLDLTEAVYRFRVRQVG